jgi:hypothetical protein
MKYKNYYYVNLKNAQVEIFRGQFHSVPEALEYASKKYIDKADKPSLRGFMVLLEANGSPSYPVGYKHPRIPNIAMSRQVDITKAQSYLHTYRKEAISKVIDNLIGDNNE